MATNMLMAATTSVIRVADSVYDGLRRRCPTMRLRDGRSSLHGDTEAGALPDRLRICIRWDNEATTDASTPRVTLETRAGTGSKGAMVMQQAVSVEALPMDTNTQGQCGASHAESADGAQDGVDRNGG